MSLMEAAGGHFVLIHGASHGAWCWYKLRLLLESAGHRVTCIDLACSGINLSDADSCFTFKEYNKPLFDFMATLSLHQKVILVGHSAGGINVTQIMYEFPQNVRAAVYVAAAMEPSVSSAANRTHPIRNLHMLSYDGKDGDIWTFGFGLGVDQPPTSMLMKPQYVRQFYFNMSPLEDVTLAKMLLRPFPVRAMADANFEADEAWERVPRVYIKTLHDNVINREREEAMLKEWPPTQLHEIDCDHSPFFSDPSTLFGLLLHVATAFT